MTVTIGRRTFYLACTLLIGSLLVYQAAGHSQEPSQDKTMVPYHGKTVSVGRADLWLPEDASVGMIGEVNEVNLNTNTHLAAGESFAKAWSGRVKKLEMGQGEIDAHTAVLKQYPATSSMGQVYFQIGTDPDMLVVLERWKLIGTTVVVGRTDFKRKFLPQVEENMENVFAHLEVGGVAGPGDFVVNNVIVHCAPDGEEATKAEVSFSIPGADGKTPMQVAMTYNSELLTSEGSVTVLDRMRVTRDGARDAGVSVDALRAAKRTLAGLSGEESILRFSGSEAGTTTFRIEWGAPGRPSQGSAPQTSVEWISGKSASPSQANLLSYWDQFASSMRFRK